MTWRSSWLASSARRYISNEDCDIPVLAQTSAMVSPLAWRYKASLNFDGGHIRRAAAALACSGRVARYCAAPFSSSSLAGDTSGAPFGRSTLRGAACGDVVRWPLGHGRLLRFKHIIMLKS